MFSWWEGESVGNILDPLLTRTVAFVAGLLIAASPKIEGGIRKNNVL